MCCFDHDTGDVHLIYNSSGAQIKTEVEYRQEY